MSPDDIVNTIAGELGLSADVNVSSATATYHQMNESNMALMRVLNGFGVAIRIVDGDLRVRPEEDDAEPIELSPKDSALKVRLIAFPIINPQVTVKALILRPMMRLNIRAIA